MKTVLVCVAVKSVVATFPVVDGKRKRRHSHLKAKRDWYARHRAERFARHLGFYN